MYFRTCAPAVVAGAAVLAVTFGGASALEADTAERDALKACEKSLCDLVVRKGPETGDLSCALAKTWAGSDLKNASSGSRLKWGFGDAHCSVDLKLARATIVSAVKSPKSTLQFPLHTVNCVIERKKKPAVVTATLAPRAEFEGGKVKKVWVNLKDVKGPAVIKGFAYTAARLEASVGLFHGPLVRSLNKMLHETCPRVAAGN